MYLQRKSIRLIDGPLANCFAQVDPKQATWDIPLWREIGDMSCDCPACRSSRQKEITLVRYRESHHYDPDSCLCMRVGKYVNGKIHKADWDFWLPVDPLQVVVDLDQVA